MCLGWMCRIGKYLLHTSSSPVQNVGKESYVWNPQKQQHTKNKHAYECGVKEIQFLKFYNERG